MKKFTKNFLDGGHRRSLRILRSVALGLIALVWTHSVALAQCDPPAGTVYFMADDVEACYMGDNMYTVDILVKDFMNVDSIDLFLDYDQTYWTYEGFTILDEATFDRTDEATPGVFNHPLDIDDDGDVLNIYWSELSNDRADVGAGVYTPIIELEFSLNNFPNNNSFPYDNPLEWDVVNSTIYYCGGGTSFLEFGDDAGEVVDYTDGNINVAGPETAAVEYTLDPLEENILCWDSPVEVEIISPVGEGAMYRINGTAWTEDNTFNTVPGTQTVRYITADGCMSTVQTFEINGPDSISFDVDVTDAGCVDDLGTIIVDAEGGTGAYTYWVLPYDEAEYIAEQIFIRGKDDPMFDDYKTPSNIISRDPGRYYVAVDDANECASLLQESDWEYVEIEDGGMLESMVHYYTDTVTCPDGSDGAIELGMYSQNYKDGFLVSYNGMDTLVAGTPVPGGYEAYLDVSDLEVGTTIFYISDSMCAITDTAVIVNKTAPTFYVGYTDAPCTAATGTIYLTNINGETDMTAYASDGWTFWVDGAGVQDTAVVGDTITDLPSGYYEAWLISPDGCDDVPFYNTDLSGNTIPILDNGQIEFTVEHADIACVDSVLGSLVVPAEGMIWVPEASRSCENCNEGAVYQFSLDSVNWYDVGVDTIMALDTGAYVVTVRDEANDTVCYVTQNVYIDAPDEPLMVVVDTTYSPTCVGGNDGWVRMYVSGGTPPYQYSVDEMPNWRANPSFGLTEGEHLLRVMDAYGCEWSDIITVDSLSPIMITGTIDTIECANETNPISIELDTFTHYSDMDDYTFYYSEGETSDPILNGISFIPEELGTVDDPANTFGAGTYLITAKDPNGCYSNVDTLVLDDVPALEAVVNKMEDATCYGTWSGLVEIEILSSNPNNELFYAKANNPDVFINPNANIDWIPIPMGDTIVYEELQKGTYWIQVVDSTCNETTNPASVTIEGYDPIEIDGDEVDITNVSCNGDADGEIMIPAAAVTGGAPGGYDGLGGEGAMGNYLYTVVHLGPDTIVGTELQESNMYSGLVAGDYRIYVYDTTDPEGEPAQCAPDSTDVEILEPMELDFDTELTHVSCNGVEDGEILIDIWGGTGGSYGLAADPDTDGKKYSVTINQIVGNGEYSYQLKDAIDTIVVQVMGGEFEIEVTDGNGCSTKDTVTIIEPAPWVITTIVEEPSDCNIEDGEIWAVVTGGLDTAEVGDVEVWVEYSYDGNTYDVAVDGDGFYAGDTILVTDSAVYDVAYTITVGNVESDLSIELADEQCTGSYTETIETYNPFVFDVAVECVKCYGESNGKVTISNITGGVGPYQIQLVGGDNPSYNPGDNDLWWPKDAEGDDDYETTIVFDTLAAGDYWIYLRDTSGFTLANCCRPEKFTMCEPDSLILESVTLVSNVNCYGDSTGALSIQASGGTGDYEYAITKVTTGFEYVGVVPEDAVWYPDSIITGLPVGTYIGWVRDANLCETGCEINSEGLPIDDHRVVIREAGMVAVDSVYIDEPICYEGMANVELWGVVGGTGDSITFQLAGKTYAGMDTTYMFGPLAYTAGNDYILEDVYASDTSGYVLTLATEFDCESEGDTIMVTQPDVFTVEAMVVSGGICAGDAEAAIEISVTAGGVAPYTYTIYDEDGPVPGRENTTIVNHVLALGSMYVIEATDDIGCTTTDTLHLESIEPVTFTVENLTCAGDTLASARIVASGTPGRKFTVSYKNIEDGSAWVDVDSLFSESIEFDQIFEYDAENLDDVHYAFEIFDESGCSSGVDTLTFDIVQNEIAWDDVIIGDPVNCETPVEVSVTGGIPPYTLFVNGEAQAGMTAMLASGSYEIMVMDSHECYVMETVDAACELTIAEVQSMKETSDYVGDIVQIEGTVSAVAEGGFYVQDDNAAWSGIWVASDSTVAIGDGVTVSGTVAEIDDVTTITDATVTVGTATLTVEAIEVLPENIEDEMYESVLVVVVGVRANAATDGIWTAFTEETAIVTIDTLMYTADPVAGDFYTVTGIVNGMDSMYYVEPRMESDVVNNSINEDEEIKAIEFKVYPNPFNDRITIDNNEKLTRVIISNIAGQRVIDIEYPRHEIRTANLVSGVYLVRMFTEEGNTKTVTMIKR